MKCQYFPGVFLEGFYHFLKTPKAPSSLSLKAKEEDSFPQSDLKLPFVRKSPSVPL